VITRTAKLLLLAGVAFFYSLVVFNNLTDFNSNYQLVRHVLMMDTTFPGNHGMCRALTSSAAGHSFYIAIIAWEIVFREHEDKQQQFQSL
jgi:predicted small integral membrane protein